MTQSLVLIKPDAIREKLLGWSIACFEKFGIEDLRLETMDNDLCDAHYWEHREKPFYYGLKEFMVGKPLAAMIVNGPVGDVRQQAMQIRAFHKDLITGPENLVHSSDSILSAYRELDLWFPTRPIRWNPWNKVVQDHRDGTIDMGFTDTLREAMRLPQWSREVAEKEVHEKPVFYPLPR